MGGHQAGEVASRHGHRHDSQLPREQPQATATSPGRSGSIPALSFNGNRLVTAVELANRRVFQAGEEQPDLLGHGHDDRRRADRAAAAHVLRRRRQPAVPAQPTASTQLTHDDSWVATVLAQRAGRRRVARWRTTRCGTCSPTSSARATRPRSRSASGTLQAGDMLLLCSDGLHGTLDDEAMQEIVAARRSQSSQNGGGGALERNASDNVTALLVRCDPTAGPARRGPRTRAPRRTRHSSGTRTPRDLSPSHAVWKRLRPCRRVRRRSGADGSRRRARSAQSSIPTCSRARTACGAGR